MGSHPEGPSRSDGISLMLSRLRRFLEATAERHSFGLVLDEHYLVIRESEKTPI